MTQTNDSVATLSRALDQTAEVLAAIGEDQLSNPTPCSDWDVAHLIGHVLQDTPRFLQTLRGEQPDWGAPPEPVTSGWVARFRSDADELLQAWRQLGDDVPSADWQTAEYAVHTWDLVKATGQERSLDPEVAERGYAFVAANLTPENRGGAFGPAVEVSHDADPYDRIAAFTGRTI